LTIEILEGNCLDTISKIKPNSINTCVTSPPYWGLRDYNTGTWIGGDPNCPHMRKTKIGKNCITGHKNMFDQNNVVGDAFFKSECSICGAIRKDDQFGLEETPEEFVENLVQVFREVKRVLRDDGTVWLNLGDSYSSGGRTTTTNQTLRGNKDYGVTRPKPSEGIKPKDLIGIPWRVAFALQADGWYLRQDIIWHKPNPMPESVKDRCTKSHEYIFLLSKNEKYYFNNEVIKTQSSSYFSEDGKANKRSVWTVNTYSYKEAHFATFPKDLIEPCVLAGCPMGGTVLDPFGGSGTTAVVAEENNRNSVICELNPDYIKIAKKRISQLQPKLPFGD
tara:strand:- start:2761 stop:3762 length:1002 start_codon:yes stop_codon:yes gene_type:complete